jgi:hypothetical protein
MRTLEALGIELPHVEGELENRTPFKGVLCPIDTPSQRPPGGAQGRRVIVTRQAAERALPSLIGAPLNAGDDLLDHDRSQPIGAVHQAYIANGDLWVEGVLYGRNFPSLVATIKRHKDQLGLSYEITGVEVESEAAPIWKLTACTFTGLACLKQSAAAYGDAPSIAARAAAAPDCWSPILIRLRHAGRALDGLARGR